MAMFFIFTGILAIHLLIVSLIDLAHRIIPNELNLSLTVCGASASLTMLDVTLTSLCLQVFLTTAIMVLLAWSYRRLRGRSGIGGGDIKYLGAATTWVGSINIPWVILIASISGLCMVTLGRVSGNKLAPEGQIAFGPHLAVGLFVMWIHVNSDGWSL